MKSEANLGGYGGTVVINGRGWSSSERATEINGAEEGTPKKGQQRTGDSSEEEGLVDSPRESLMSSDEGRGGAKVVMGSRIPSVGRRFSFA